MCMNVNQYQNEMRAYCEANKLSYERLKTTIKGCGSDTILFQVRPNNKNLKGLKDETPLPIVLILKKLGNKVHFEQTENTKIYLGA